MTSNTFGNISNVIRTVMKTDLEWSRDRSGRDDHTFLPWMPFSWPEFLAMVAEALPEMRGNNFLEVGCGPGTRMLLAREVFGLEVYGFDRVQEYVNAAKTFDLNVSCEDALEYPSYGSYDFIWMNRPIRDQALQGKLEAKVWEEMRPGAIIGCAHLDNRPPEHWYPVFDDWEIKRGVWQKP